MPIHVKLTYETKDGRVVPAPDDYPDAVEFDLASCGQVTNELVLAAVQADLAVRGLKMEDIVISWSAFDSRFAN